MSPAFCRHCALNNNKRSLIVWIGTSDCAAWAESCRVSLCSCSLSFLASSWTPLRAPAGTRSSPAGSSPTPTEGTSLLYAQRASSLSVTASGQTSISTYSREATGGVVCAACRTSTSLASQSVAPRTCSTECCCIPSSGSTPWRSHTGGQGNASVSQDVVEPVDWLLCSSGNFIWKHYTSPCCVSCSVLSYYYYYYCPVASCCLRSTNSFVLLFPSVLLAMMPIRQTASSTLGHIQQNFSQLFHAELTFTTRIKSTWRKKCPNAN